MNRFFLLYLLSFAVMFSQRDSTVKYFSTNVMRTNILKGKPEKNVNKKEAHFKAIYYPSGELKSIEYLPANWDKKNRKKKKSTARLKLYYLKWNPKTQELLDGITKKEVKNIPHYRATLNDQGLVREVDYVNRYGKMLWTFHMRWDDYGKSNEYDVEFYSKKNLSTLNKEFFSPDMSRILSGWVARYKIDSLGNPLNVKVMDGRGSLYYFYKFSYSKKGLQSKYFRSDSILVGSHTVNFNKNKKPQRINYYNESGVLKNAIKYEYPKNNKLIVSQINSKGEVIERRVIPKEISN